MTSSQLYLIEEDMEGERLDAFLAEVIADLSRTAIKDLISNGRVLVDGQARKPSYRVKEGEQVLIHVPEARQVSIKPQNIPLEIIYQDQDLAVVNKPKGMVVHPAHGNWENTMVNALLYHIKDLSGINGELRPGIVHRLDKDTSGVMVVAKHDQAHRILAEQIKEHSIKREYQALVHGVIKENLGTIEAPIGRSRTDRKKMAVTADGRTAISRYRVLERYQNYTLVQVSLLTGRTHQIRVHFSFIKHPVVGDTVYGPAKNNLGLDSQALHACVLGFNHPRTGDYMEFNSPLPDEFQQALLKLTKYTLTDK
ncbi:MAG TPA: RluA family pseudouridine synthase [Syntrophomonadaceae bacterium]|nr:RluA family pseudouridine synthase [Syntrophomonadaceae bacterium]HQE22585.1 RluA family pseudouridine synthase [Syntrophomonadaceae bacterium]